MGVRVGVRGEKARGMGKGLLKEVIETAGTGVSLIEIQRDGRREGSWTGDRMEAR